MQLTLISTLIFQGQILVVPTIASDAKLSTSSFLSNCGEKVNFQTRIISNILFSKSSFDVPDIYAGKKIIGYIK